MIIFPVAGQGYARLNAPFAAALRWIRSFLSRGQLAHSSSLDRGLPVTMALRFGINGSDKCFLLPAVRPLGAVYVAVPGKLQAWATTLVSSFRI